jgi:hypothetical protein
MTHEQAEQKAFQVMSGWKIKRRALRHIEDSDFDALQDRITAALLACQKDAAKEVCEVLEPFAKLLPYYIHHNCPDDKAIMHTTAWNPGTGEGLEYRLNVGDIRKAAALLNKLKESL